MHFLSQVNGIIKLKKITWLPQLFGLLLFVKYLFYSHMHTSQHAESLTLELGGFRGSPEAGFP